MSTPQGETAVRERPWLRRRGLDLAAAILIITGLIFLGTGATYQSYPALWGAIACFCTVAILRTFTLEGHP